MLCLTDHLLVPLIDLFEGVVRLLCFLTELLYGYFLLLLVFKVDFYFCFGKSDFVKAD